MRDGRLGRPYPRAWIDDPAYNVRYEAHQYFDRDGSGFYSHSYADEVAWAGQAPS